METCDVKPEATSEIDRLGEYKSWARVHQTEKIVLIHLIWTVRLI